MRHLDFERILLHAIAGDHAAIEEIMNLYMPLIEKYSMIDGALDEDCKQYIMIRIALQVSRFRI